MKAEQYVTLIDHKKYTFSVYPYGSAWIARAFDIHGKMVGVCDDTNPEAVALKLVKQLETGIILNKLLK